MSDWSKCASRKALIALNLLALVLPSAATAGPGDSGASSLDSMTLEQLMDLKVVSAALHSQTVADAPASVTVITADDIRKFGYRTLGEALNSVPGFYISNDRAYDFLGSRGVSTPGDYGSRYLLLINGHAVADPLYDLSGILGQELGIEMNLIKQIEIIHGPASALYGTNAVLCTINVVTKSPAEMPQLISETELGTQGDRMTSLAWSGQTKSISGLVSAAVFNFDGQNSIYIPGYDSPATNFGRAINMDGQRGYHFFANMNWRGWTFTAMSGDRVKLTPVSYADTIFNDRGNRFIDNHGFIEANYARKLPIGQLEFRASYDLYHFHGFYRLAMADGGVEDNREYDLSDWLSARLTWRVNTGRLGTTTIGAEGRFDLRASQSNLDFEPAPATFVSINKPDRTSGVFAQQEIDLSHHWKLVLGARFDTSTYLANSFSPRAALLWEPVRSTTLKFLYGRSFRNPTAYELFFQDGITSTANPSLKAERGNTFEIVAERRLSSTAKLSLSMYQTTLRDLIAAGWSFDGSTGQTLVQFHNATADTLRGIEGEVAGRLGGFVEAAASIAIQNSFDTGARQPLPNSPRQVAKVRLAAPLLGRHLTAAGALDWISRRNSLVGVSLPGALTLDATFTTAHLHLGAFGRGFDLQFGVRNLMDRIYYNPVALNEQADSLPAEGRTAFVRLIWHKE